MDGIDSSDEDDPQSVLEPAKQDKLDVHSTIQQDKSVLENSNMDIKAEKTDTVKVWYIVDTVRSKKIHRNFIFIGII